MRDLHAFIAVLALLLSGTALARAQSSVPPDTSESVSTVANPMDSDELAFVQQPTSTIAAATITPAVTIQLQDDEGENLARSGVSITLSLSSGTGELSGTKTRKTNATGLATFDDLSINQTGSKRLRAAASKYTSKTSDAFSITLPTAVRLHIQTEPSATATAGEDFTQQPILYVVDAAGNRITSDNSTVVTATRLTGEGTLQGTVTAKASSGIVTFSNLSHNVANTISIRFTGGVLVPDTSRNIVVNPASAVQLVFMQQPTDAASGMVIAPAVTVALRDAFGNAVTTSGTSVTLALGSGTGVLSGTLTRSTSSGVATFSNLRINLAGSKTLRATSGSLTAAVSNAFIISAGPAKTLAFVQQPTNAVAAAPISPAVTVQVRDSLGNTVAKSGIGITVGILSGTGTLSGTRNASTDASGLASFADLSIDLLGAKTLSAVSAGLTTASSSSFTITAGAAEKLEITQEPTETIAGASISPAVTVQIKDAQGNIVRSAGTTVGIVMTTGTGTLTGTLSQLTDASGQATFGNLSINLAGSKQFTVSSAGLISAVSNVFTIKAADASKLQFTTNPVGGVAGTAFAVQPVVSIVDAYGNIVSGMAQTVTLAIQNNAGPGGTLLGTRSIAVNQQTGRGTFTDIAIDKTGNGYTLTATGSSVSMTPGNVVSTPFSVTSGAAVKVRVENAADGSGIVIVSQNVTSGTSITLHAIARDSYDNFVSNVAASSWAFVQYTGGVATTDLVVSADKKSAVFTGSLSGTATITALATGLSSVATGTLTVVVAGTATQVRIESAANGTGTVISDRTVASGSTLAVYAIGRDAAGNFISNLAAGSWSLQNKTGGVADSNLVVSGDKKSAAFTGKLIGSARIRATSGTLTAGTSGILTVAAGPATSIVPVAGTPQSVRVGTAFPERFGARVRDAAGNPAKGILVTWTPPASGPGGTFGTGGSTATTDSAGVATSGIFTANALAGSYTVTAALPLGASTTAFLLTNTIGVAARIGSAAGSPQSAKVMTKFSTPLAAIVTDSSGNAVGGVFVTFKAPSSGPGGTFPGDSIRAVVSTGTTGIATAPAFVANAQVGSYQVMATAAGVVAGTPFELTNTAGVPGTITAASGTPQSTIVGSPYAVNLKAVVKDSSGNALPRVLVTFTAPSNGASGMFANGLVDSVLTDTTGGATASVFTANAIVGSFSVLARAQGVAATAGYTLTNQPAQVDTFLVDAAGGGKIGNQTVRVPFAIRIRAYDGYGNISALFNGTADLSSNGVLAPSGMRTANFSAGILAAHTVSVGNAGQFVIVARRTGGAETGRSDTFAVFNPVPAIRGISPGLGRRGQNLLVSVSGSGFLQGVTTVSFGDGIATSTTVSSDTAMVVTVTIDTSAALGTRDVYVFNGAPGGGVGTLAGAFVIVNNPSPTLASLSPGSGTVLQRLSLLFTGSNFFQGATHVNMGEGIEVDTITVSSPTQLAASVRITGSAAGGTRDVYVANDPPGGGKSGNVSFQVHAPPTPYPILDSPPEGAIVADTVVLFRWHSWLAAGVGYWLQISTTPAFDDPVVDDSTIADTSKQVGSLARGQKYYWRVFARNSVGSSDPSPARSFTPSLIYPATMTFSDTVWFPPYGSNGEYRSQDFRLVGIPGNCNVPVRLFLSGESTVDWVVYWDNGAATDFMIPFDGSAAFNFSPGRAFWILNKGSMKIATSVPALPLDSARCAVIPLHSGWNLIANPFLATVQWSSVQTANGTPIIPDLWGYNGSFSRASVLMPCTGYMYDNADNRTSIRIPFGWVVAKASAPGDPASWRMSIQLASGGHTDEATGIGISLLANEGRDIQDLRMPRGVGETPGVYFERPGWDAEGSVFATDIRKEIDALQTWPMSVRAAAHEPARLSFSGVQDVPPEYEVLLIDDEHGRAVDLRKDPLYAFTPPVPVSKFRIVVGSEESARRVLSDLLPKEFALGNNFPNPFNPTTTIPVAIPRSTTLVLKVYSILGEEVQTLFAGALEPGYHWFTWDGTNAAGRTVASGVYLIRLTAEGGHHVTGKMILTK